MHVTDLIGIHPLICFFLTLLCALYLNKMPTGENHPYHHLFFSLTNLNLHLNLHHNTEKVCHYFFFFIVTLKLDLSLYLWRASYWYRSISLDEKSHLYYLNAYGFMVSHQRIKNWSLVTFSSYTCSFDNF